MTDIVDFYAELGISKELSLAAIQAELTKLERVWHQREIAQPEKARKMLVLIDDAKTVFETEESRAKFDQSIKDVEVGPPNMDDPEQQECIKHYDEAKKFHSDGQFDLAKICIDKAVRIAERRDNETQLNIYTWAAEIYIKNELFADALSFINQVISLDPEWPFSYETKEGILISLIQEGAEQNRDVSKYVSNHRKTCEMWAQKGLATGYNQTAAAAMVQLGKSYYFDLFGQPNFDLVEKYANQALEYEPDNTEAKQMLRQIEMPRSVDRNGLQQYWSEASPYVEDIKILAEQIISSNVQPECELGWIMTKKRFFGQYNPNKDGMDEEETWDVTFVLTKDGKFMKYCHRETEYWRQGSLPWTSKKDEQEECGAIPIMTEMDFDGRGEHSNGQGWTEHGDFIGIVSGFHWTYYNSLTLTRKYRKKGQGLYNRLKEIVDKAAAYIEECNKINAEYNKEIEPLKQEIADRYAVRRKDLEAEFEQKKAEAVQNQQKIADLEQQISSARNEFSSLGFFAMKRKKELEAKIQAAYEALSSIETVEKVTSKYSGLIRELEQKEESEIREAERTLRAKYPLPTQ